MKTREWVEASLLAGMLCLCTAVAQEEGGATGSVTIGGHAGAGPHEVFGDVVIPVCGDDVGMAFVNPRASVLDGIEKEVNIGAGYRALIDEPGMILGGNVFYDSRWSRAGNQFDQFGLGVEALSAWIDFRFNYYVPEMLRKIISERWENEVTVTSERHRGRPYRASDGSLKLPIVTEITTTTTTSQILEFEEALEGWDVELGAALPRMPDWLEARIFGSYYNFWSRYGSDRLRGFRGRVEIRPFPSLMLDGEVYDNPGLNDTAFFVGARLAVPFDLYRLKDGGNPFAGWNKGYGRGKRTMRDRMAEMIVRDFRVQTKIQTTTQVVGTHTSTQTTRRDKTLEGPEDDDNGGGMTQIDPPSLQLDDGPV